MTTLRILVWAIGLSTVAVYVVATGMIWQLVRLSRRYPRWVLAWVLFTVACGLLSVQRMWTVLYAPRTLLVRDVLALIVSVCLVSFVGLMVKVFRDPPHP